MLSVEPSHETSTGFEYYRVWDDNLVNIVHAFNLTTTNGTQNFSHSLNQTTPYSHELATVEPLIKNK